MTGFFSTGGSKSTQTSRPVEAASPVLRALQAPLAASASRLLGFPLDIGDLVESQSSRQQPITFNKGKQARRAVRRGQQLFLAGSRTPLSPGGARGAVNAGIPLFSTPFAAPPAPIGVGGPVPGPGPTPRVTPFDTSALTSARGRAPFGPRGREFLDRTRLGDIAAAPALSPVAAVAPVAPAPAPAPAAPVTAAPPPAPTALSGIPAPSGPLTAPIEPAEEAALAALAEQSQQVVPPEVQSLLAQTIAGDFLPQEGGGGNPFLQAIIEASQRPLLQGLEETLSRTLPGRFTQAGQFVQPGGSSAFDRAAAIATRGAADAAASIAAQLGFQGFEAERARQQEAIQLASGLQRQQIDQTIANLQAQALPRLIEEQGIQRGLETFNTRLNALLQALGVVSGTPITQIASQASGISRSRNAGLGAQTTVAATKGAAQGLAS